MVGPMPGMTTNTKMALFLPLLFGFLWIFPSACGDVNDIREDIAPLVNEKYHVQYAENGEYENCFVCHPKVTLHLRASNPYIDLDLIRETVEQQGLESCRTCHYDDEG